MLKLLLLAQENHWTFLGLDGSGDNNPDRLETLSARSVQNREETGGEPEGMLLLILTSHEGRPFLHTNKQTVCGGCFCNVLRRYKPLSSLRWQTASQIQTYDRLKRTLILMAQHNTCAITTTTTTRIKQQTHTHTHKNTIKNRERERERERE